MNNIFLETIFYYLIYLISLLSISGYGIVVNNFFFNKKNKIQNIFSNFFWGLPLLLLISFFIYISIGYSKYLNLFIIVAGFIFFYYFFPISKKTIKQLIIPSLLFVGLLISKTHEDFNLYHYQHLKEIFEGELKFGLANLEIRYGYSSLFTYVQAIFNIPILNFKLFHVPVYLIYVSLVCYSFEEIKRKNNPQLKFLISFIIIVLIIKFTRLSEFGYDYINQFVLLFLFIEFLSSNKNHESKLKIITQFIFAITIKVSSILFFPIVFFFLLKKNNFFLIFFKKFFSQTKIIFFITCLIGVLFFNSFIKTGCIIYSLKNSCFSSQTFHWVVPISEIQETNKNVFLSSKSYEQQNKQDFKVSKIYFKNFNWVDNWFQKHFFYKISEFILILLATFFLIYFFIIKNKKLFFNRSNFSLFAIIISGLILWFLILPGFRYGISLIILGIFYLLSLFLQSVNRFDLKKFYYLFFISLIFFNLKNFQRIKGEFQREDIYQFSNFPWHKLPERKFVKNYDNDGDIYYTPADELKTCWNIPTICSYKKISIYKSKYYIAISRDEN